MSHRRRTFGLGILIAIATATAAPASDEAPALPFLDLFEWQTDAPLSADELAEGTPDAELAEALGERVLPGMTIQDDGRGRALFVFGGAHAGGEPRTGAAKTPFAQVGDGAELSLEAISPLPLPLDHARALPVGTHHVLVLGELSGSSPPITRALLYHTVSDRYTETSIPAELDPRTASLSRDGVVHLDARGGDAPRHFTGTLRPPDSGFAATDYVVIAVYLAALVVLGWWFSRKEGSTERFFLGGRKIPWWAAGLSIFGTQLSAITFMAIPALVYRTDWVYFLGSLMIVVMAPVIVYVYLPFYRGLNLTTAYEYLEHRFNLANRLIGSASFLLFQVGRMGIVLFLPSLALSTVTGIDVYLCIVAMGVLATIYTVLGGIEAVIWTDVLQVFVLLGGAFLSIGLVIFALDGDVAAIWRSASDAGKLRMVQWDWSLATTGVAVVVVGRIFDTLPSYTADQAVVQRYLTTKDEKMAARAIWTNAVLSIPALFTFFGLGTVLWAFYRAHPERLHPAVGTDNVLPWFVAQELPLGVAGLVIAGLFAASMSSLDSSMNSMSTAITTDFYRRLKGPVEDRDCLRLAKVLTVLLGLVGTSSALYMAWIDSKSMWDQYTKVVGLFAGGLAGLFAAGIFVPRISGPSATIGFFGSAVVLFLVKQTTQVHFFLYAGVGVVSCVGIAALASLALPADPASTRGLTWRDRGRVQELR